MKISVKKSFCGNEMEKQMICFAVGGGGAGFGVAYIRVLRKLKSKIKWI